MIELPIPPAAVEDAKSRELARIWAAGSKQHVTLATGLWEDPASWRIMLVDLALHIANAYELNEGVSKMEALRKIKAGFDVEWQHGTDNPTGELMR